jgi:surfactin synthase thioesterase subunit
LRFLSSLLDQRMLSARVPSQRRTQLRWWRPIVSHGIGPARLQLFCFPHGGASSLAFRAWQNGVPSSVDACAAQLPGRTDRLSDAACGGMDELVERLATELAAQLVMPYALFGVSFGALLCFELARALRRRGSPTPLRVILAAYPAPHLPHPLGERADELRASLGRDDQTADIASLKQLGLIPARLSETEARHIALPPLRADFGMLQRYVYREETPLDVPLTVLGGKADPHVPRDALEAWRVHSRAATVTRTLDGGHLFYQTHATETIAAIMHALGVASIR